MRPRTPLTAEQVTKRLADTGWAGDTSAIRRTFAVEYDTALRIVAEAGEAAIEPNHRPDVDIRWDRPSFQVTTHTAGDVVTELDFKLAERINEIALRHGAPPLGRLVQIKNPGGEAVRRHRAPGRSADRTPSQNSASQAIRSDNSHP